MPIIAYRHFKSQVFIFKCLYFQEFNPLTHYISYYIKLLHIKTPPFFPHHSCAGRNSVFSSDLLDSRSHWNPRRGH